MPAAAVRVQEVLLLVVIGLVIIAGTIQERSSLSSLFELLVLANNQDDNNDIIDAEDSQHGKPAFLYQMNNNNNGTNDDNDDVVLQKNEQTTLVELVSEAASKTESPLKNSSSATTPRPTKQQQPLRPPSKLNWKTLEDTTILFLHVGKAGGGTVNERRQDWRLFWKYCHPAPCQWTKFGSAIHPETTALIISLRDPVDRFVSDFYWFYVDPWIQGAGKAEHRYNRNKYHHNVNEIGAALCSANDTIAAEARRDMKTGFGGHHSWNLADWLLPSTISYEASTELLSTVPYDGITYNTTNDWRNFAESIVPMVQEPGFYFTAQVDEAIRWAFRHRYLPTIQQQKRQEKEISEFSKREVWLASLDKAAAANINTSSTTTRKNSAQQAKQPLAPEGAKCLAQYYAKDYQILQQMVDRKNVCKFPACTQALQSILKRYQERLNYNLEAG